MNVNIPVALMKVQGHREFDMLHHREYNKLPMHKNHELIADQNDQIRRYQLNQDINGVNIWMEYAVMLRTITQIRMVALQVTLKSYCTTRGVARGKCMWKQGR